MSRRALIIIGALITIIVIIVSFVNSTRKPQSPQSSQSKTDQPLLNISMNPKSGTLSSTPQTISVIIQPLNKTNTISAMNLVFNATGALKIVEVSKPATYPDGKTTIFSEIMKEVSADKARMSYVITLPDNELPTSIELKVVVSRDGEGIGGLALDSSALQIVGNIPGYTYEYDTVDSAEFR